MADQTTAIAALERVLLTVEAELTALHRGEPVDRAELEQRLRTDITSPVPTPPPAVIAAPPPLPPPPPPSAGSPNEDDEEQRPDDPRRLDPRGGDPLERLKRVLRDAAGAVPAG